MAPKIADAEGVVDARTGSTRMGGTREVGGRGVLCCGGIVLVSDSGGPVG